MTDSEIKEKILELFSKRPKHFNWDVKNTPELKRWVDENARIPEDLYSYSAYIYSAIYDDDYVCSCGSGKYRKFYRFTDGFYDGCGNATSCSVTKSKLSESIRELKSQISEDGWSEINEKRAITNIKKYGVPFNSQREDVKVRLRRPKIALDVYALLNDASWLYEEYITKRRTLTHIAAQLGVDYSTVGEYCRSHGMEVRKSSKYSDVELDIFMFLQSVGFEVVRNDRSILPGRYEIDLVVPEKKLAIEVNGLFWHSWHPSIHSLADNKQRHISKTNHCLEKGFLLLHITDYMWKTQKDIVKNILCSKLGINQRKIPARKCTVVEVDAIRAKEFANACHIQGHAPANTYLGLECNGELVSLATFAKARFSKDAEWELVRFCTKPDTTVVGGLSKLMCAFGKDVVSYCAIDLSNGNGYLKAGFELLRQTKPGYFWTDGDIVVSRFKCQKKNLAKWLTTYDPSKTERENMFDAGYRVFWDCGNYVYLWKAR